MRFVFRFFIVCLAWVAIQKPAFSALNLELTQGVSHLQAIAVLPFAGEDRFDSSSQISRVVTHDFNNSGRFKALDDVAPESPAHTDYWRSKKIDNVVVGSVKPLSRGRYQVNFSVYDVVKSNQQGGGQLLLTGQFDASAPQLRALSHRISDKIYKTLTGIPGVFSTRIVYVLGQRYPGAKLKYTLQAADYDGYNPRSLLTSNQPIMSPAWSHDGKRIAYVSFEKHISSIYIQNVASGSRQLVSRLPGINGAPAWSPNDQQLAMALSRNTASPKIFVMNLGSRQLRQITQGSSIDTEPSWSPDSKSLLFTSDRGGGPQIYQANLASGAINRLTFSGDYNARASFSPDGKTIVMINREGGGYNIAVQSLENGTFQKLTQSGYDASPSFAPNGQLIVYESDPPGGQGVLGVVSRDGRVKWRLPASNGSVQDPAWSPFF